VLSGSSKKYLSTTVDYREIFGRWLQACGEAISQTEDMVGKASVIK